MKYKLILSTRQENLVAVIKSDERGVILEISIMILLIITGFFLLVLGILTVIYSWLDWMEAKNRH